MLREPFIQRKALHSGESLPDVTDSTESQKLEKDATNRYCRLSLSEVTAFPSYLKFVELRSEMKQSTQISFFRCARLLSNFHLAIVTEGK